MLKRFVRRLLRGPRLQPIWARLHDLSLSLMNVSAGSDVRVSGETWVIEFIGSRLPSGRATVFVDVGANVGNWTSAVVSSFGGRAKVYCLEPSQAAFSTLTRRLGDRGDVFLHNVGLGSKDESVTLYSDAPASGNASVYCRPELAGSRPLAEERIKLRTLDGFCLECGITHIDLLKLDTEGHELEALRGARRLLAGGAIDMIQWEFGVWNLESRTYFRDFFRLLSPSFEICRIVQNGLAPIAAYSTQHEVFHLTNYLAVSKAARYYCAIRPVVRPTG